MHRPVLPAVAASLLLLPALATGQARPFVYTQLTSGAMDAPRVALFGDVGYGHRMFAALGPEKLEQRLGAQVRLAARVTLLAQAGLSAAGAGTVSRGMGQAEVLGDLLPATSRAMLAVGVGGMRDYRTTGVATGRVVAGYRWARTLLVGNLRLERAFARTSADPRDALDVSTTIGASREVTPLVRVGLETVAEDLEGLVDREEAEGGAKLMVGPSVRVGLPRSRWGVAFVAGPVLRLSNSAIGDVVSGAPRELQTAGGYVVRTSLTYRW